MGTNYFIAVSHVWSDGLGNPRTNSLPYSQMESLYDRLQSMAWQVACTDLESGSAHWEYNNKREKKLNGAIGKFTKAVVPAMRTVG